MKSLFTESSPSDGTISALSTTPPRESPLLTEHGSLDVIGAGFSLVETLHDRNSSFHNILVDCDFVPFLKSAIVASLDLLESSPTPSKCENENFFSEVMSFTLDSSWHGLTLTLCDKSDALKAVVESALSDAPQFCSLLERTCRQPFVRCSSHLEALTIIGTNLPHLLRPMLEENLLQRVMDTSRQYSVPITNERFHVNLVWAIYNMLWASTRSIPPLEKRKKFRLFLFERVLKPVKQYLQFVLQREECFLKGIVCTLPIVDQITALSDWALVLEKELFEDGEIAETGREEWEVGWLVEKTDERVLGARLEKVGIYEEQMRRDENERCKKRVERQREAGLEDAVEGWLMRMDNDTPSEMEEYVDSASEMSGMKAKREEDEGGDGNGGMNFTRKPSRKGEQNESTG
ncbi:hypothetical protein BLNAU_14737 [Blattamonas nauphoetae]|uniref:Uncharacterized protein n=1 Tax=Blattamonas nauphoetae TaxID=2049346 RepID=A0ABQ9XEE0_9EUKA|nr:hypothetical protein BLNAU_14737 [Blattamonas nauphoetae]